MSKKLMLLAAGALAALAFAALPAVASAGEFKADCETGAECSATIAGNAASLGNTNGETISCETVTGNVTITSGSSTFHVADLTFHGCKETATVFRFSCNSTSQPSGTITTNTMIGHYVYIDPSASTPGVLLTGVNTTFECTGFSKKTVTGNIIGHITNPNCGTFQSSSTITFEATAHGQQKYKQVTTTSTVFDLISNNHAGGSYLTSAQTGSGTVTVNGGNKVKLTC